MNRRNYFGLLVIVAVCAAMFAWFADAGNLLLTALSFPFAPIGALLRRMSMGSTVGNLLAWLFYLLLCAVPAIFYVLLRRKNRTIKADGLLLLLSAVLAVVLYKTINPYGSYFAASSSGLQMLKAQYGSVFYVTLTGWLIIRTVNSFSVTDENALYKALAVFLKLLGVLFVIAAFGGCFGELLGKLESIRSGNQNSGSLALTYQFAVLHCIVDALPYLLNTVTIFIALELLHAFTANSEHTVTYAKQLAKWCGTTLTYTAITGIAFHIAQMLFINDLRNLDASVSIPIASIAFVVVCLITAHIVAENKTLRDDNDLFI